MTSQEKESYATVVATIIVVAMLSIVAWQMHRGDALVCADGTIFAKRCPVATIYGPSHFVVDVALEDEGGRHVLSVTRMEAGNKKAIVYRLPTPAGGGYAPASEVLDKENRAERVRVHGPICLADHDHDTSILWHGE